VDLADFLLARIAEDEEAARAAIEPDQLHPWGDRTLPRRRPEDVPDEVRGYLGGTWGEHFARWDPARVLAECDAKRRIVQWVQRWPWRAEPPSSVDGLLPILALPYADHPDYREEWRH
jgi:hypothetical protein